MNFLHDCEAGSICVVKLHYCLTIKVKMVISRLCIEFSARGSSKVFREGCESQPDFDTDLHSTPLLAFSRDSPPPTLGHMKLANTKTSWELP